MKKNNPQLQELQPEQPQVFEQISEEILDDGQTEQIPDLTEEMTRGLESVVCNIGEEIIEGIFTREEFKEGFYACFDIGGELTELKSLPIKENERQGADRTADKLYDIAVKYPALRWMINRNTAWMADMTLIGYFCYSKANAVLIEVSGRSVKSAIKDMLPWSKKKEEKKAEYKAPPVSQAV